MYIKVDMNQAMKDLHKAYGDLTEYNLRDVTSKSIDSAMRAAKYAGFKKVSEVYNINQKNVVTSKLKTKYSRFNSLEAILFASYRGIQLSNFSPAMDVGSSFGRGNRNISVEIVRGQRKTIPSAFFVTARRNKGNEVSSIFARGRYKGRNFEYRTRRIKAYPNPDTPIQLLRTVSPLKILENENVVQAMTIAANAAFEKSFVKSIKKLMKESGG